MTNEEKGELAELRKTARSKTQKCYNPSCNNQAIRSHIQQAEGAIRNISSASGKIAQLEELDTRFHEHHYMFREKGIKQRGDVLTFWGFCNSCDAAIFKNIEAESVDYSSYKNQLLYSYRGFLSEHYKQEYNVKWYDLIFKSKKLSDPVKESFRNLDFRFKLSVKMGRQTKLLLEKDINQSTKNFEFLSFKLPRIDICTSTAYALPVAIALDDNLRKAIEQQDTFPLISTPIFINLIPHRAELNVIIGCLADTKLKGRIDIQRIIRLGQKEKIKLISDILIKNVETWFVSLSLYNTWKLRKMDKEIIIQIEKYLPATMKTRYIKFNMFQDIV